MLSIKNKNNKEFDNGVVFKCLTWKRTQESMKKILWIKLILL